eukprot:Opistho-2@3441
MSDAEARPASSSSLKRAVEAAKSGSTASLKAAAAADATPARPASSSSLKKAVEAAKSGSTASLKTAVAADKAAGSTASLKGAAAAEKAGSQASLKTSPAKEKSPAKAKGQSVTDRLTDASKFTGAHKERFDESGKGKGLAGREELVNVDGSTSSAARDHTVKSSTAAAAEKKPVVSGNLGKEKFGTQADKPISITLFRNGDKNHAGEKIVPAKFKMFRTMDQLHKEATDIVKLVTGPVRKIYKADCKTQITALDQFENGGKYLCCSGEAPAPADKLPAALTA